VPICFAGEETFFGPEAKENDSLARPVLVMSNELHLG
jgi:hypothetical protein